MADGTNICERCGGIGNKLRSGQVIKCPKCEGKGWYSYNIIYGSDKSPGRDQSQISGFE